jgi:hypothetical protein
VSPGRTFTSASPFTWLSSSPQRSSEISRPPMTPASHLSSSR